MNFSIKKIANPYSAFAIAWLVCLLLYALHWADIFPALSGKLFAFLALMIAIFGITAFVFNKIPFPSPRLPVRTFHRQLLVISTMLFMANFLYSGVPLLQGGTRELDFGVPTVIVFTVTLNSFTCVYCFYLYLLSGRKRFLVYVFICLSLFLLMFSRGNIMMTLVTMFFLWINVKRPAMNVKGLVGILAGLLLVMYLFGVAGNIRTINDIRNREPDFDNSYNSEVIMGLSGASETFRTSIIPGEFFWTYLYVTSPLSNLQYNVNIHSPGLTLRGMFYILIDELMFDTVSKRADSLLNRQRPDPELIVDQLTVTTTLTGSYNYAGWGGMVFFMAALWFFPFLYSLFILNNPLGIIGISTLSTVFVFSIFDNMFILTGLTLQIVYPLLMHLLFNVRFNYKFALRATNPE